MVCLATPCHAQDSIAVVDRGVPPRRIWAVVELPFKLLEAPFRLLGGAIGWVAGRAEAGGWVPAVRRAHDALAVRGIRPSAGGQGPNSGFGPILRLGQRPATGRSAWAYVQGGVTLREYWHTEARAGMRWAEAYARVDDRPRDPFYGIGNGARETDWSDYRLHRSAWGARATIRAPPSLRFSTGIEWTRVATAGGTDDGLPDIDSLFAPGARPGFGETHRAFSVSAGTEWWAGARHSIARRGSWVTGHYRWIDSRSAGVPDVGVARVTAGVELPFDHHRRSVAVALDLQSLRPASPGIVPFYLLPTMGGAQSLPSFRSDRFRGRDVLVAKLEYRYRVWSNPADALWADAVLFTNGGVVAERLSKVLGSARLQQSTGFAIALLSHQATIARFGVSAGADGVGATLTFGTGF